jgi:hypothetical protein
VTSSELILILELTSLNRIAKKWKWTGELFIDIDQDKSERLCEIILTDATDYFLEGLRLHILLEPLDSIRFGKLHDISELGVILPACKPSEQVARLGPQNEKDAPALKCLASYLESKQQVRNHLFVAINTDRKPFSLRLHLSPWMASLSACCWFFLSPRKTFVVSIKSPRLFIEVVVSWQL